MAIIRSATPQDIPHILKIVRDAIDGTWQYPKEAKIIEKDHCSSDLIQQAIDDNLCVVVEGKDGVLGACFGEDEGGGVVWLSWVVVAPEVRQLGMGEILINQFLIHAAPLAHKVSCSSLSSNTASLTLLRKIGFKILIEIPNHWHHQDYYLWHITLNGNFRDEAIKQGFKHG